MATKDSKNAMAPTLASRNNGNSLPKASIGHMANIVSIQSAVAYGHAGNSAAVLLGCLQNGEPLKEALAHTASSVYGLLCHTAEAKSKQLKLVSAQKELVAPSHRFEATSI